MINAVNSNLLEGPCNKLYKKSLISYNDLYFDEHLSYAEDWLFNVNYFAKASKVAFTTDYLYFYNRTTTDSLSKKFRINGFRDSVYIRKQLADLLPELCSGEHYCQKLFSIQNHYLRLFVSINGYNEFYTYVASIFSNEDLHNAYLNCKNVPKSLYLSLLAFKYDSLALFKLYATLITIESNLRRLIKQLL